MSLDRWIGIIGLVVGVVAIPIGLLVARKSRRRPTLRTVKDFDVLMDSNRGIPRDALKIAYADRDVKQISRTNIAIWNDRGDTINGSDIVSHDPLRVQLADTDTILQVQPLTASREQCKLIATLDATDPTRVLFDFDFLDAGDGGVFEVLHTGDQAAVVTGTTRGSTLSHKGSSNLTPAALDIVAINPAIKRISAELKRSDTALNLPTKLFSLLMPPIAVILLIVTMFVTNVFHKPILVDVSKYDLTSIEGQSKLANKVTQVGEVDPSVPWLILIVVALGVFTAFFGLSRTMRVDIPRTIVNERYYRTKP